MTPYGDGTLNARGIPMVSTSHDIGMITAAKLVGICWAGLLPIVFPAWLIVQGEIRYQNHIQDSEISQTYVSKAEFVALKESINDLKSEIKQLRADLKDGETKQNGRTTK